VEGYRSNLIEAPHTRYWFSFSTAEESEVVPIPFTFGEDRV